MPGDLKFISKPSIWRAKIHENREQIQKKHVHKSKNSQTGNIIFTIQDPRLTENGQTIQYPISDLKRNDVVRLASKFTRVGLFFNPARFLLADDRVSIKKL